MAIYRSQPGARGTMPRAMAGGRGEDLLAENRKLTATLAELKEQAARNDSLLRKTQERELELLRAATLPQLFERLIHGLRRSYQLDLVTLTLDDPSFELRHLLWDDPSVFEKYPQIQFTDSTAALLPHLARLDQPWLGSFNPTEHDYFCAGLARVGSLALIPLRRNEHMDGVLTFASYDPGRFNAELASDFLAHLGMVAAICVENAANRARLLRSGLTDFLTGFHNRRYLSERLREELARAQRFRQPIACLMIDVDNFKPINDKNGHLGGDAVLREVAKRINGEMRVSDIGARFGGDEFSIVLPQADLQDGERVANRVLESVRGTPIKLDGDKSENVTLSIGVAVAEPKHDTKDYKLLTERLLAEADAALYRSKQAGRNRVAVSRSIVT
jgi:two-component system, cell cycle response regulator